MIGYAEPRSPLPPSRREFPFFNDPRTGDMRIVGRHGDIVATVATAFSEASEAPRLATGATRILVETGSQATCMRKLASFGATEYPGIPLTQPETRQYIWASRF